MSDDLALQPAAVVTTVTPFRLTAPLKFLFGDRDAILTIAATPNAVFFGLLLVITAGFAREYDGEDLVGEPWYLLIPVVASLATSFILFGIIWNALPRGVTASFIKTYESFLSLYWMTAPLAWIYAIPVERIFSPGEATRWNLIFLLIVSVWRVLLITRVVSVVFNVQFWRGFFPVMFFADIVILFVLFLTPMPVFDVMGGIRLTDSENIILSTKLTVGFLSVVTFPVWLIGMAVAMSKKRGLWQLSIPHQQENLPTSVWMAGAVVLLFWIGLSTQTQPAQRLRRTVEHSLYNGKIRAALTTMSSHERDDFPPHWDPPPHVGYGKRNPPILDVVEILSSLEAKSWVHDMFWAKLRRSLGHARDYNYRWHQMSGTEFERYLDLFEAVPEGQAILREYHESIRPMVGEPSIGKRNQERLRTLLTQIPEDESSRPD